VARSRARVLSRLAHSVTSAAREKQALEDAEHQRRISRRKDVMAALKSQW
jgi:hypothetical protein